VAYLYSTGSRGLGDIEFEGDPDETQIDFEDDFIALKTAGNQVLVVSGSNVGVGTAVPSYNLHIAAASSAVTFIDGAANTDAFLRFGNGGVLKAYIKHGSGGNLVITNETSDRDIIFKVKDSTTEREALRLNGDVAEVVVNEGSDSLVDFRVESDNNTHMLFVDGSNDKVGINTDTPNSGLHVNTSVTFAGKAVTQNYTVLSTDHMIFANATNGNITLTLPTAVGIIGRQYIIKRVDGSANSVIIDPNASETIEGDSNKSLTDQCSVVIVSDNNNWWITSEYISPPP
tara:strand:- start:2784 stop:3644 length:861 start_codon:yes stop_codon:yes gene_type:complete